MIMETVRTAWIKYQKQFNNLFLLFDQDGKYHSSGLSTVLVIINQFKSVLFSSELKMFVNSLTPVI